MSYEELEPAKYQWKQYGIKVKIDNKKFDDMRNVQAYLRIKKKTKEVFSKATTNVGLAELFKGG